MVTLVNAAETAFTIMLTHDTVKHGYKQSVRDKSTGAIAQKRVELTVPRSVTLGPGQTLSNLPDSVLGCPDVMVAIKKGLKVLVSDDTATASAPTAAPSASAKKTSRSKGK